MASNGATPLENYHKGSYDKKYYIDRTLNALKRVVEPLKEPSKGLTEYF